MAGPNLHLDPTVGCLFIGVLFAILFYSCTCAQTLFYFRTYPNDRPFLKLLVAFLSALDLVSLILDIEYLWDTVVTNHSNPGALNAVPTVWIVEFFVASLTFFLVQCYFINKIWALLAGKWYRYHLTGIVTVLALACFAGGVGVCYISSLNHGLMFILTKAEIPACLQQVAAVITDIYITLSLCVVLRGSQSGFERTKTLLDKLTVYAIHRGILTATVQLLHFATYLATYHNSSFIWMIFHIPSTKIYVNSLLAVYVLAYITCRAIADHSIG
ncbi:hypothetical protein OBBRIDRAFT_658379 [Obba rivulosa]|uniref:DUF6534 domain-containing protein n=1 Tax=Obba rivulosa TaxID=1052685 RepID=A0A8E2AWQ2_9APHY|nr:hypothetical protein OBBRIDRAFT_658379 [Obba rivulosa]